MRSRLVLAGLLLPALCFPQLRIERPLIHQIEEGSPVTPAFPFTPGEMVYVSFAVAGYLVSPDKQIKLTYSIDVLDPQGVRLVETIQSNLDTAVSAEDKQWKPLVRQSFLTPSYAPPGIYQVKIQVTDELAHRSDHSQAEFALSGHAVKAADALAILGFGFYRSEEDEHALAPAAYRAGDQVFARFEITGYKFGPGNGIDVGYGVSVLDPDGKTVFSQPNAAVEKSASFYPRPSVPGAFSLDLKPGTAKGEYTLAISAHDGIGLQNREERKTFRVE